MIALAYPTLFIDPQHGVCDGICERTKATYCVTRRALRKYAKPLAHPKRENREPSAN